MPSPFLRSNDAGNGDDGGGAYIGLEQGNGIGDGEEGKMEDMFLAPPSHMERGSSTVTINRLKKVYQKRFCGIAYASTRLGCFFKTSAIAIGVVALVLCVLLPATVSQSAIDNAHG